jgi:hypothetical protein
LVWSSTDFKANLFEGKMIKWNFLLRENAAMFSLAPLDHLEEMAEWVWYARGRALQFGQGKGNYGAGQIPID